MGPGPPAACAAGGAAVPGPMLSLPPSRKLSLVTCFFFSKLTATFYESESAAGLTSGDPGGHGGLELERLNPAERLSPAKRATEPNSVEARLRRVGPGPPGRARRTSAS